MAPGLTAQLRSLYHFAAPRHRRQFQLVTVLTPLAALAELVTVAAVVPLIAVLTSRPDTPDRAWVRDLFDAIGASTRDEALVAAGMLFVGGAIGGAALRLLLSWSSQRFAFNLGHDLALEIQRRVLFQPYSFHVERNSSQIIASLEKVEQLVFGVLLPLVQASSAAIVSLFIVAGLVAIDARSAAIAALLVVAIYGLVLLLFRRRLAANSAIIGSAYQRRVQTVQESLGAIREIIVDHSQAAYLELFRAVDEPLMQARASTVYTASAPRHIVEALALTVLTVLAVFIASEGRSITSALPALGALILGAQRLIPLTHIFYHGWTTLAGSRSIIDEVVDLLSLPLADESGEEVQPIDFRREVRLAQVGFTYLLRPLPALEEIDLVIRKGARVALVGRTGSGKSTLADLFMGLLQPTAGQITVDGETLTPRNARAWQRNIAHVPQFIFLTDASIARNIAFGEPSSPLDMARVARAAEIAQLGPFIASLPDGFQTIVGERGVRLSGGQRQRLGLARAIYKRAPVLVLDEATSALDYETEAAVLAALHQLNEEGETILIIAHRLSTIATCDMVVRLEGGRIVAMGQPADLLGTSRSFLDDLGT